ncbi:MAG: cell division protein FtsA [Myxococcales bacterium]|nr:cell division protein FtsA [Myxococcales bacterium]
MKTRNIGERIVAADIGTSKICVVVGEVTERGIAILGSGISESRGLSKGEVVELERTAQCLANAIEDAESQSGHAIDELVIGISAGHIRGGTCSGEVDVHGATVTPDDIDAALEVARAAGRLEANRVWLHTLVREFVVDGRDGVKRPVGMPASKLVARVHLVSAARVAIDNISAAATRCGVRVRGIYLDTLASSTAVLSETERERGCVLVDIGGGTTDLAIWSDGALCHTAVVQTGGDVLTGDVGLSFRLQRDAAERLKRAHGAALRSRVEADEFVPLTGVPGRTGQHVARRLLATVCETRMDEILRVVHREVELSGYRDAIGGGYVLTGGAVRLPGTLELAEHVFGAPVRLGAPTVALGLSDVVRQPQHATVVGLLEYAASTEARDQAFTVTQETPGARMRSTFRKWIRRIL